MKTIEEATIEDLLGDLLDYEDRDSFLIIGTNENGEIIIFNYRGGSGSRGNTLKEVLVEYGKNGYRSSDWLYDGKNSANMNVDWRT